MPFGVTALSKKTAKTIAVFFSVLFIVEPFLQTYAQADTIWEARKKPKTSAPEELASLPAGLPSSLPPPETSLSTVPLGERFSVLLSPDQTAQLSPIVAALSSEFGTVRRLSLPTGRSNGRVVVQIEDVHQNEEAQRHIGAVVQRLIDGGNADVVALEGAFQPLELDSLRRFHDRAAIQEVADYFLKICKISGPVHAALTLARRSGQPLPPFVGIDDRALYDGNVEAYRMAAARKDQARFFLEKTAADVNRQREKSVNPTLSRFDAMVESYRTKKISLGDYLKALSETVRAQPVILSGAKDLLPLENGDPSPSFAGLRMTRRFLRASELERRIDTAGVERERNAILQVLAARFSVGESTRLLNLSVAFRTGQLSRAEFYREFRALCGRNGIDVARYPEMDRYLHYVFLVDQVDADALLRETSLLEERAYSSLARTPEEKKFAAQSQWLRLARKLVDFSMTSAEWERYKGIVPRDGHDEIRPFEVFYEMAQTRDRAMAENFLKTTPRGTAVLATGGFHSSGITDFLTRAGYTVVSFLPHLTKIDSENGSAYLGVFAREKTPFDRLCDGRRLFLATSPTVDSSLFKFSEAIASAHLSGAGVPEEMAQVGFSPQAIAAVHVEERGDAIIVRTGRETLRYGFAADALAGIEVSERVDVSAPANNRLLEKMRRGMQGAAEALKNYRRYWMGRQNEVLEGFPPAFEQGLTWSPTRVLADVQVVMEALTPKSYRLFWDALLKAVAEQYARDFEMKVDRTLLRIDWAHRLVEEGRTQLFLWDSSATLHGGITLFKGEGRSWDLTSLFTDHHGIGDGVLLFMGALRHVASYAHEGPQTVGWDAEGTSDLFYHLVLSANNVPYNFKGRRFWSTIESGFAIHPERVEQQRQRTLRLNGRWEKIRGLPNGQYEFVYRGKHYPVERRGGRWIISRKTKEIFLAGAPRTPTWYSKEFEGTLGFDPDASLLDRFGNAVVPPLSVEDSPFPVLVTSPETAQRGGVLLATGLALLLCFAGLHFSDWETGARLFHFLQSSSSYAWLLLSGVVAVVGYELLFPSDRILVDARTLVGVLNRQSREDLVDMLAEQSARAFELETSAENRRALKAAWAERLADRLDAQFLLLDPSGGLRGAARLIRDMAGKWYLTSVFTSESGNGDGEVLFLGVMRYLERLAADTPQILQGFAEVNAAGFYHHVLSQNGIPYRFNGRVFEMTITPGFPIAPDLDAKQRARARRLEERVKAIRALPGGPYEFLYHGRRYSVERRGQKWILPIALLEIWLEKGRTSNWYQKAFEGILSYEPNTSLVRSDGKIAITPLEPEDASSDSDSVGPIAIPPELRSASSLAYSHNSFYVYLVGWWLESGLFSLVAFAPVFGVICFLGPFHVWFGPALFYLTVYLLTPPFVRSHAGLDRLFGWSTPRNESRMMGGALGLYPIATLGSLAWMAFIGTGATVDPFSALMHAASAFAIVHAAGHLIWNGVQQFRGRPEAMLNVLADGSGNEDDASSAPTEDWIEALRTDQDAPLPSVIRTVLHESGIRNVLDLIFLLREGNVSGIGQKRYDVVRSALIGAPHNAVLPVDLPQRRRWVEKIPPLTPKNQTVVVRYLYLALIELNIELIRIGSFRSYARGDAAAQRRADAEMDDLRRWFTLLDEKILETVVSRTEKTIARLERLPGRTADQDERLKKTKLLHALAMDIDRRIGRCLEILNPPVAGKRRLNLVTANTVVAAAYEAVNKVYRKLTGADLDQERKVRRRYGKIGFAEDWKMFFRTGRWTHGRVLNSNVPVKEIVTVVSSSRWDKLRSVDHQVDGELRNREDIAFLIGELRAIEEEMADAPKALSEAVQLEARLTALQQRREFRWVYIAEKHLAAAAVMAAVESLAYRDLASAKTLVAFARGLLEIRQAEIEAMLEALPENRERDLGREREIRNVHIAAELIGLLNAPADEPFLEKARELGTFLAHQIEPDLAALTSFVQAALSLRERASRPESENRGSLLKTAQHYLEWAQRRLMASYTIHTFMNSYRRNFVGRRNRGEKEPEARRHAFLDTFNAYRRNHSLLQNELWTRVADLREQARRRGWIAPEWAVTQREEAAYLLQRNERQWWYRLYAAAFEPYRRTLPKQKGERELNPPHQALLLFADLLAVDDIPTILKETVLFPVGATRHTRAMLTGLQNRERVSRLVEKPGEGIYEKSYLLNAVAMDALGGNAELVEVEKIVSTLRAAQQMRQTSQSLPLGMISYLVDDELREGENVYDAARTAAFREESLFSLLLINFAPVLVHAAMVFPISMVALMTIVFLAKVNDDVRWTINNPGEKYPVPSNANTLVIVSIVLVFSIFFGAGLSFLGPAYQPSMFALRVGMWITSSLLFGLSHGKLYRHEKDGTISERNATLRHKLFIFTPLGMLFRIVYILDFFGVAAASFWVAPLFAFASHSVWNEMGRRVRWWQAMAGRADQQPAPELNANDFQKWMDAKKAEFLAGATAEELLDQKRVFRRMDVLVAINRRFSSIARKFHNQIAIHLLELPARSLNFVLARIEPLFRPIKEASPDKHDTRLVGQQYEAVNDFLENPSNERKEFYIPGLPFIAFERERLSPQAQDRFTRSMSLLAYWINTRHAGILPLPLQFVEYIHLREDETLGRTGGAYGARHVEINLAFNFPLFYWPTVVLHEGRHNHQFESEKWKAVTRDQAMYMPIKRRLWTSKPFPMTTPLRSLWELDAYAENVGDIIEFHDGVEGKEYSDMSFLLNFLSSHTLEAFAVLQIVEALSPEFANEGKLLLAEMREVWTSLIPQVLNKYSDQIPLLRQGKVKSAGDTERRVQELIWAKINLSHDLDQVAKRPPLLSNQTRAGRVQRIAA